MSRLYSVGELLIDFQSVGVAPLKDTQQFVKKAGGAPANVCVQAVKLGQQATYLTKVGCDAFGEFLVETLANEGIDVSYISKSTQHDTSLAFVSFAENGEREFSFYRRNAADLYFTEQDFKDVVFQRGDVLEFGSVALKTDVAKATHKYLINKAREAGALVCFDPNLRFNLWENKAELREVVKEFAVFADVIKVGEDELSFISEAEGMKAVKSIFTGNLKVLLLTNGGKGAKLYLNGSLCAEHGGYKVKTVDTTGAGDSFFGACIAQLMECGATPDNLLSGKLQYDKMLDFACKCGAFTTMSYGAIAAMGNKEKIDKAVK
ncbi:MAG: carbohydrate kinase [Clostridiales bacterium]|nr:carbohydrate kinase [Clostridiales bacterium]